MAIAYSTHEDEEKWGIQKKIIFLRSLAFRYETNIKMDLRENGWVVRNQINLA
jgi:hypothetical protein